MKILVYRYNSIFEPDVIEAFKSFGVEVDEETTEITNKALSPSSRIDLVSKRILKASDSKNPYLFVFSINFYPEISAICTTLHTRYVCWSVDCPVLELFSNEIKNEYNRVFLFDRLQYERLHKYNENGLFHLPLASGTERMDKVISTISNADRAKFSADISFVGSLYSEKNKYRELKGLSDFTKGYVDGLVSAQLMIYGVNFIESSLTDAVVEDMKKGRIGSDSQNLVEPVDRFAAAHEFIGYEIAERERQLTLSTLSEYFDVNLYTLSDTSKLPKVNNKGSARSLDEMPKIFNLSKINLNMTMRSIQTGLPLRIFDIVSAGGFCMTNYQEELPELFDIGVDLEAYSSLEELVDKCSYYLSHEDERKRIALNGYEKAKTVHNIRNRVAQMIKNVE